MTISIKTHQHFIFAWQQRCFANRLSFSDFTFGSGHIWLLVTNNEEPFILISYIEQSGLVVDFGQLETVKKKKKHYLCELKRVDFWQWRTEDFLRSSRRDPHQIQEPFPVFVPLGPVNVQRGFDWRLPQVVYLWIKAPRCSSVMNRCECTDDFQGLGREELTVNVKFTKLPISSSVFMALSPLTRPPKETWLGLASLLGTAKSMTLHTHDSSVNWIVIKLWFNILTHWLRVEILLWFLPLL